MSTNVYFYDDQCNKIQFTHFKLIERILETIL